MRLGGRALFELLFVKWFFECFSSCNTFSFWFWVLNTLDDLPFLVKKLSNNSLLLTLLELQQNE